MAFVKHTAVFWHLMSSVGLHWAGANGVSGVQGDSSLYPFTFFLCDMGPRAGAKIFLNILTSR